MRESEIERDIESEIQRGGERITLRVREQEGERDTLRERERAVERQRERSQLTSSSWFTAWSLRLESELAGVASTNVM